MWSDSFGNWVRHLGNQTLLRCKKCSLVLCAVKVSEWLCIRLRGISTMFSFNYLFFPPLFRITSLARLLHKLWLQFSVSLDIRVLKLATKFSLLLVKLLVSDRYLFQIPSSMQTSKSPSTPWLNAPGPHWELKQHLQAKKWARMPLFQTMWETRWLGEVSI